MYLICSVTNALNLPWKWIVALSAHLDCRPWRVCACTESHGIDDKWLWLWSLLIIESMSVPRITGMMTQWWRNDDAMMPTVKRMMTWWWRNNYAMMTQWCRQSREWWHNVDAMIPAVTGMMTEWWRNNDQSHAMVWRNERIGTRLTWSWSVPTFDADQLIKGNLRRRTELQWIAFSVLWDILTRQLKVQNNFQEPFKPKLITLTVPESWLMRQLNQNWMRLWASLLTYSSTAVKLSSISFFLNRNFQTIHGTSMASVYT